MVDLPSPISAILLSVLLLLLTGNSCLLATLKRMYINRRATEITKC